MKRVLLTLIVPLLFVTASGIGPLAQTASADSGRSGGGRGGLVARGDARGAGDVVVARSGGSRSAGRGGAAVTRFDGSRGYSGSARYVRSGGHHRHGGHFSTSLWIGPGWGWGPWDPFYYPGPYYYPYPYPSTTVVVPREPDTYIMQEPQPEDGQYWYYCKEANGYYPYVERCPGGWMKVVPYEPRDTDQEE